MDLAALQSSLITTKFSYFSLRWVIANFITTISMKDSVPWPALVQHTCTCTWKCELQSNEIGSSTKFFDTLLLKLAEGRKYNTYWCKSADCWVNLIIGEQLWIRDLVIQNEQIQRGYANTQSAVLSKLIWWVTTHHSATSLATHMLVGVTVTHLNFDMVNEILPSSLE